MANLVDISKLARLYEVAVSGRSKSARTRATNELTKILITQAERANRRMSALEKAGYDYGNAYDTAITYLEGKGRRRFSKRGNIDDIYEEALRTRAFLATETSTVSGQKKIEKKRNETFRTKEWDLPDMSDDELKEFQRFLGNASVDTYLSFYADSNDAVEELAQIFDSDDYRDKLKDLFAEYNKFLQWREENPYSDIRESDGIGYSELRKGIDSLYESISKRRR